MDKILFLCCLFVAYPLVVVSLRCFSCSYTYSKADMVEEGLKICADQHFGLSTVDPNYVVDFCVACEKEYTYLDADRYAVVRSCKRFVYPIERFQKFNSCSHIDLNQGNYTRCVCDSDFCNEKQVCDEAYGCWEGGCPTCPCQ